MKTIVYFDNMDNDGKCSGAIVKQHLEDRGVTPVMVGLDRDLKSDNKDWHEFLDGNIKEVWFTDLRPRKLEDFEPLENIGEVTIIDHHEFIDLEMYQNIDYIHTTEKVSATMIAWKHLYFDRVYVPRVIELVNDRDVWINAFQPTTNYFFNVWKLMEVELFQDLVFYDEDESILNGLLSAGKALEDIKQRKIREAEKEVTRFRANGWLVAVSNIENGGGIVSELGNKICREDREVDFYANITKDDNGVFNYNLRSLNGVALNFIKDNGLKGGGHPDACGFKDSRGLAEILMSIEKRG